MKWIKTKEIKMELYNKTEEVKKALYNFEYTTLRETGVHRISGGFAKAKVVDYDEDYFYIELRYGVKSDCEDDVTVEQYKMDRVTLKIEDC